MKVVTRPLDGVVSLLVDEIGDVLDINDEDFEPSPATLRGVARRLISDVYKLKDGLMLVHDPAKAVQLHSTVFETTEAAA